MASVPEQRAQQSNAGTLKSAHVGLPMGFHAASMKHNFRPREIFSTNCNNMLADNAAT
jgi:hypothetical protein